MIWKPHVTVAALIENAGRFLCVEETIDGARKLNQPAGHLDPGESLIEAVSREALEETARIFEPEYIVGIYLWRADPEGESFLRVAFAGPAGEADPDRELDSEIESTVWLSSDEIQTRRDEWRSPLVMQCIRDYLAGTRYPLALLQTYLDTRLTE